MKKRLKNKLIQDRRCPVCKSRKVGAVHRDTYGPDWHSSEIIGISCSNCNSRSLYPDCRPGRRRKHREYPPQPAYDYIDRRCVKCNLPVSECIICGRAICTNCDYFPSLPATSKRKYCSICSSLPSSDLARLEINLYQVEREEGIEVRREKGKKALKAVLENNLRNQESPYPLISNEEIITACFFQPTKKSIRKESK